MLYYERALTTRIILPFPNMSSIYVFGARNFRVLARSVFFLELWLRLLAPFTTVRSLFQGGLFGLFLEDFQEHDLLSWSLRKISEPRRNVPGVSRCSLISAGCR